LDHFHAVNAFKDREEERDLLYNEVFLARANDINAIAYIVWMLDKEEDARAEELLGRGCENKGE
jgi:hypothetical protein